MKRQGISFIRCRGEVCVGNSKHYDFLVFCGKGVIVDLHLYDYPIQSIKASGYNSLVWY